MAIKYLDAKRIRGKSAYGVAEFDGTGDYARINNSVLNNVTDDWTVAMWYKTDDLTTGDSLIGCYSTGGTAGWVIYQTSNVLEISAVGYHAKNEDTFSTGRWYHVAWVCTGGTLQMFVDGVVSNIAIATGGGSYGSYASSQSYGHELDSPDNTFNFGQRGDNQKYLDGRLQDVGLWTRGLSSANIVTLASGIQISALSGYATDLQGLFEFDGNFNSSVNSYTGTAYGDATTSTSGGKLDDDKATLITLADGGWTTVGTLTTITDGWVDSGGAGNNADHRIYKNTGITVSNTAWVCDFEFYWSGSGVESGLPIGFYSATGIPMDATQDMIGCAFGNGGNLNIMYKDGSGSMSGTSGQSISASTTYYCRLTRTTGTEATLKIYPTESDRTNGTNQHGSTVTQSSLPSTVIGLDYVQHSSTNNGGTGTGQSTWKLTNVKFYNGMTSVSGTPAYETAFVDYSDLPENTLFEETDTRNVYGLSSAGEWDVWYYGVGQAPLRGVFMGGEASGVVTMDYITIDTLGNATDFGDTQGHHSGGGSVDNGTRGVLGGMRSVPSGHTMDYITIATLGNVSEFGNLSENRYGVGGVDDQSRGVFAGGYNNTTYVGTMDYITIGTLGNATAWGTTLTATRSGLGGNLNNNVRGVFADGYSYPNVMDYVTIQTTGACTDFGDMTQARGTNCGVSSVTTGRGIISGGNNLGTQYNIMEYIAIASTGNATDFGDLSSVRAASGGVSTDTRACIGGGVTAGSYINNIEYITMATTGNTTDFGDLTVARSEAKGVQGS